MQITRKEYGTIITHMNVPPIIRMLISSLEGITLGATIKIVAIKDMLELIWTWTKCRGERQSFSRLG